MRHKYKVTACVFAVISTIVAAISIYYEKKFEFELLNHDMYILESKRNIRILDDINSKKVYSIEYMSAVGLAYNIVDLAQQGNLKKPINFSYMCKEGKWQTFQKYIKKALSDKNRNKFPNKSDKNQSLYSIVKKRIDEGMKILEKSCTNRR